MCVETALCDNAAFDHEAAKRQFNGILVQQNLFFVDPYIISYLDSNAHNKLLRSWTHGTYCFLDMQNQNHFEHMSTGQYTVCMGPRIA